MLLTRYENEGILHAALICRGNEKLTEQLLTRQSEILNELYGDGPEENTETLEASMHTGENLSPDTAPVEETTAAPEALTQIQEE